MIEGSGLPWKRDTRTALIEKTGQTKFPAIEFEDGTALREESADLVQRIRAGELGTSAPAR